MKYCQRIEQILASEQDVIVDQESDSALMTESDKFKKFGPVVKTFKSSSNPNKSYEVRQLKDQDPTCNCPGWANRRTCKHTDAVKHNPAAAAAADLMNRYFQDRVTAQVEVVSKKAESDPSLKAPKEWWVMMTRQIKKGNPNYSEEQIRKTIGSIWSKLSAAKKSEIRKRYGKTYGKAPKQKAAASVIAMLAAKYL